MDWLDEAREKTEAERDAGIARARRQLAGTATPFGICLDCGEAIPEARQAALPGCVRCIHCQTASERRRV